FDHELIGFTKLYEGSDILRTVHIIAKLGHRDKPVQDAMIAKAVQICDARGISRLHYGAWSQGGLGAFKVKHGFRRADFVRYFVPLTFRGNLALKFGLHREIRHILPASWVDRLILIRKQLSSLWLRNQSASGPLQRSAPVRTSK